MLLRVESANFSPGRAGDEDNNIGEAENNFLLKHPEVKPRSILLCKGVFVMYQLVMFDEQIKVRYKWSFFIGK